jgi:aspartate/methionine/tyrosine aminotransferase
MTRSKKVSEVGAVRPAISAKARTFKRSISPVRQIMSFADSNYIRSLGINPDDLISYAGGWVNHAAPEELREAYREIAADDALFHKSGAYSHTLGDIEFKEAVVKFEKHVYGKNDLDPSQVSVSLGGTQAAMALFEVILDPGDKVLLLDPSYCNYPTQLVTGIPDVKILRFPVLDERTWEYRPDSRIEGIRKYIDEHRPKVVLLISPDNPTSQVLSQAFVTAVLDAVTEIGSYLVMDFAYKEIVFNNAYPEYFSWGPRDNFISVRSNSKWCRGLGRRLGWLEAPPFVVEAIESIQNSTILSPDTLHQMAMTRYVNKAIEAGTLLPYLRNTNALYQKAAQRTVESITTLLGFPALEPAGGLFTCMPVGTDGGQFVKDVLTNAGVLFVPGWGFGRTVNNAVRVSYGPLVNDLDKITLGFERVAKYLGR